MARMLTKLDHQRGGGAKRLGGVEARPARSMLVPLATAQFLASYDASSMNVAIGRITKDLGTTVTGVQTVITLFTLTMAALMIPGSKLSDIWGRKRCFRIGIAIYGIGALITSLSPTLPVMILGFSLLEGIGSALMIPPIYILITVSFADSISRTKAFALVSAAAGLGSASGPLIGGFITTTITWRASFLLEALTTLVILYSSRRIFDTKTLERKPEFDLIGAALSAVGLAFIVIGVLQAGTFGWLRARKDFTLGGHVLLERGDISPVVLFMTMGIALLAVFFLHVRHRERSGKTPLISTRLFNNRTVNLGLVTQHVQWFMMLGTFFVVSVFLQVSRGYDAIRTGVLVTPATLGILLSSTRMGKLTQKYSPRAIIRAGFVIALTGIVLLLLLVDAKSSVLFFVPGLFLIGFGAGVMLTTSVNVVQSSVPDEDQGEISGVSRSVSNLGSSLGTAVAGAVLISALNAGIASHVAESAVLSASEKQQMAQALERSVSTVTDAQVREALQGKPPAVVEEVTRINAMARDRAMGLALATVGLFGLIGLFAAMFLPPNTGRPRPEDSSTS
jgi:MFS family permease